MSVPIESKVRMRNSISDFNWHPISYVVPFQSYRRLLF